METLDGRLAQVGARIDDLGARARNPPDADGRRILRRVDEMRDREAELRMAWRSGATGASETAVRLDQLDVDVDIACAELDAAHAADRASFEAQAQTALDRWSRSQELLAARVAAVPSPARRSLEALLTEARRRQAVAAQRLRDLHDASDEAWKVRKAGVALAFERLERSASTASRQCELTNQTKEK
jgi:hypothetical protein